MFQMGALRTDTLRECFHHHDWARDCVLTLAASLPDKQLDGPTAMGWGSLRETILQLCTHGTHHRTQALNMLRHPAAEVPELDYYTYWYSNTATPE